MEMDAKASIEDWDELKRTGPVLLLHDPLLLRPPGAAHRARDGCATGAAVALLITRQTLEETLAKIEWPTLIFFVALFVMVGALEATGAIKEVAKGSRT